METLDMITNVICIAMAITIILINLEKNGKTRK
jgi:hypothetical protein